MVFWCFGSGILDLVWQLWYFEDMHLLQQGHKSVTLRVSYKSVIPKVSCRSSSEEHYTKSLLRKCCIKKCFTAV